MKLEVRQEMQNQTLIEWRVKGYMINLNKRQELF